MVATLLPDGRRFSNFILLSLLCLILLACSGFPVREDRPRGIYHRVRSGETLSIIARAYRVDLQELAEINNIDNPNRIATDDVIFIPDAHQIVDDVMAVARPQTPPVVPRAVEPPARTESAVPKPEVAKKEPVETVKPRETRPAVTAKGPPERPRAAEKDPGPRPAPVKPEREEVSAPRVVPGESDRKGEQIQFDKKRFIWPVKGKVVAQFGIQPNRMYNNGIRIAAAEGAAVQAAADGLVIFSAPLKDYGETIIIQHEGQYATVYTHLGVRTVRGESRIRKGDRIAFLGKAENQEDPSLHFEVRYKNKARNPLFFLP